MRRKVISGMIMLTVLLIGVLTFAFNVRLLKSVSTTIIVPDDYPTIQGAINAATKGDTVYVRAETYYEHLIVNKSVSLVGEDRSVTTVDGNGTGKVVTITQNNVNITGFTIRKSGSTYPDAGIYVDGSACYFNISGNNIANNYQGIFLREGSKYNTISGNNIMNNNFGMRFAASNHYNTISGNNITNNSWGIFMDHSSSNTVSGNNITNNSYGVRFAQSSSNTVSGNNITNNTSEGVKIQTFSSSNTVSGNNITNNSCGIYMDYSSSNTISGNNITNNSYGMKLYWTCENNNFHHNNFVSNTQQLFLYDLSRANFWDDGYPSGGNYWSDQYHGACADHYKGPAQNISGSDGIVDDPYVIEVDNRDNYPIMVPGPWTHDIAIINVTPSTTEAYAGQTVEINVTVKNWGDLPEIFNITAYYDNTAIETQDVSILGSGEEANLTLSWNTTGVVGGYYIMSANASAVPDETDIADNIFVDGTVKVTSPVRIVKVIPCNQTGYSKDTFELGAIACFKVTINSTATIPQDTLITINLYDNASITIGVAWFQGPILPGASIIAFGLLVPTAATIGTATVYANAYTDWPHLGGFPHCPEKSATLEITEP